MLKRTLCLAVALTFLENRLYPMQQLDIVVIPNQDFDKPEVLLEIDSFQGLELFLHERYEATRFCSEFEPLEYAFRQATALLHNPKIKEYRNGVLLGFVISWRSKLFENISADFENIDAAVRALNGLADDFLQSAHLTNEESQRVLYNAEMIRTIIANRLGLKEEALQRKLKELADNQEELKKQQEMQLGKLQDQSAEIAQLEQAKKDLESALNAAKAATEREQARLEKKMRNQSWLFALAGAAVPLILYFSNSFIQSRFEGSETRLKKLEDAAKQQDKFNESIQKQQEAPSARVAAYETTPQVTKDQYGRLYFGGKLISGAVVH